MQVALLTLIQQYDIGVDLVVLEKFYININVEKNISN
jgi:hypothetical protein